MRKRMLLLFAACALLGSTGGALAQNQPLLVSQPVYEGMQFFVCQPSWAPPGWYMTYDGYPVSRGFGGVWYYGIPSGESLVPSAYVVGSIVPAQVPLVPFTQIVSAVSPVPVIPYWLQNSRFVEVAAWNFLVDRMGMLERPRVPLAWKGDRPACIFAWTGKEWYKMLARDGGESPGEILKRHGETLQNFVRRNGFIWNDADTPTLANQAAVWGFLWMGHTAPLNMW